MTTKKPKVKKTEYFITGGKDGLRKIGKRERTSKVPTLKQLAKEGKIFDGDAKKEYRPFWR